jgi:hypothetical protein
MSKRILKLLFGEMVFPIFKLSSSYNSATRVERVQCTKIHILIIVRIKNVSKTEKGF